MVGKVHLLNSEIFIECQNSHKKSLFFSTQKKCSFSTSSRRVKHCVAVVENKAIETWDVLFWKHSQLPVTCRDTVIIMCRDETIIPKKLIDGFTIFF